MPTLSQVQNYWDSRPCNIRHSRSEIGTRAFFEEVEARKYFVEPHIPAFADFATWKGKRVLEIGCGIGTDAINFARAGAVYSGVELSIASLELTRKRFEVFGQKSHNLLIGNAEEIADLFPGQIFDLVYSFGVLHHTPSIENSLASIRKISGPDTTLKIMVYAKNSYKQAMIDNGLDQPEAQFGCPIANSYTKAEITELLNAAGFEVNNISQDHIFPYKVEPYKNYEYLREDWFHNMPPEVFKILEKNFGWHLLVDASPS
jgi:ubiquinone/menaquinone biosynthesis C-methylase UbiE